MAVELGKPAAIVGVPFTTVFAKTRSADLSAGWALIDPTTHVFTKARYSACPTLRYVPEDKYFYLIVLFSRVANHTHPGAARPPALVEQHRALVGDPCCYVQWIVRSKNLSTWQGSPRNPILGWPDLSDHMITPGSLLDTDGTPAQKATSKNYTNINRSDMDLVELPANFVADLVGGAGGASRRAAPIGSPCSPARP